MADKKILSQAIASLVEGNEAEAKKAFSMFINEAKVEIIAEKLTEKEEVEEVIPTDDEVATLKDEITVEEPAEEIDLDAAPVEEPVEEVPAEELPAEEVPAEETTEVVPVETAEEALADSGEEVGIEEDPDFLALVDEFNKSLEADAVEVPAEEVAEPVEEVPAEEAPVEEVPADDELVDLDAEPVAEEEPVAEPVEEPAEEKQEEIDIEKFVK